MATYILTWNPRKWEWVGLDSEIQASADGSLVGRSWSTGTNWRIRPGDRLFLLRQGEEPRGIMASGSAIGEVYAAEHYDPARAAAGEEAPRVMVEFDAIVKPGGDGFVPTTFLREQVPNAVNKWTPYQAGWSLTDEQAEVVEELWSRRIAAAGLSPSTDVPPDLFREGERVENNGTRIVRNRAARQACIEHHGSACFVCGFDFGVVYGELGEGFVHVHHIEQIAEQDGPHDIDPVRDLVPVCPNCHAMLHRGRPAKSIEELRAIMQRQRQG